MPATTTLLTVEEFLQLPEKPGVKRELREGVVIELPTANAGHEIVKTKLNRRLAAYLQSNPVGEVFSETAVTLSGTDFLIASPGV